MITKELFKTQLEKYERAVNATNKLLSKRTASKSHLGKEFNPSEQKIYWALLPINKNGESALQMIEILEEEFNSYEEHEHNKQKKVQFFPMVKLKSEKDGEP